MDDPSDKWRKLAAAARRSRPEPPPPPPRDFARRVIALREVIVALSKILFWRRWLRWAALVCLLALAMVFLILRATKPKPPLIEPPRAPLTPASSP